MARKSPSGGTEIQGFALIWCRLAQALHDVYRFAARRGRVFDP
jgi:hypothetical protein